MHPIPITHRGRSGLAADDRERVTEVPSEWQEESEEDDGEVEWGEHDDDGPDREGFPTVRSSKPGIERTTQALCNEKGVQYAR